MKRNSLWHRGYGFLATVVCAALVGEVTFADEPVTLVIKKDRAQIVSPDGKVTNVPKEELVLRNQANVKTPPPKITPPATKEEEAATDEGVEPKPESETPVEESAASEKAEGAEPGATGEETATKGSEQAKTDDEPGAVEGESAKGKPEVTAKAGTAAQGPAAKGAKPKAPAKPAAAPKKTPAQIAAEAKAVEEVAKIRAYGGAYFFDKSNNPLTNDQVDQLIKEGKVGDLRAKTLHQEQWAPQIPDAKGNLPESSKTQVPESAY
jgi:hypothetical protein